MAIASKWTLNGIILPDPHSTDPTVSLERGGGEARTMSGKLHVDELWVKQTFEIPMENIDASTYAQLEQLWRGVGPYPLVTPYGDSLQVKFSGPLPRAYPRMRHPMRSVSFTLAEA